MTKPVNIGLIIFFVLLSVLFLFVFPAWANNQPVDGQTAGTIGASITGSAVVNQVIEKFKESNQPQQTEEKPSQYSLIGLNNRLESTEISLIKLDRKLRIVERYLRNKFPSDFDPKETL